MCNDPSHESELAALRAERDTWHKAYFKQLELHADDYNRVTNERNALHAKVEALQRALVQSYTDIIGNRALCGKLSSEYQAHDEDAAIVFNRAAQAGIDIDGCLAAKEEER